MQERLVRRRRPRRQRLPFLPPWMHPQPTRRKSGHSLHRRDLFPVFWTRRLRSPSPWRSQTAVEGQVVPESAPGAPRPRKPGRSLRSVWLQHPRPPTTANGEIMSRFHRRTVFIHWQCYPVRRFCASSYSPSDPPSQTSPFRARSAGRGSRSPIREVPRPPSPAHIDSSGFRPSNACPGRLLHCTTRVPRQVARTDQLYDSSNCDFSRGYVNITRSRYRPCTDRRSNNNSQGSSMPRILVALLTLLLLSDAARSDTPPSRTDVVHATLFNQAHPDNRLLRSRAASGFNHPAPAALSCCTVCSVGKSCGNT
jgi:hypothetical protein